MGMKLEAVSEDRDRVNVGIIRRQHEVGLACRHNSLGLCQSGLQLDLPESGILSEAESESRGALHQGVVPLTMTLGTRRFQAFDKTLFQRTAEQGSGIELIQCLDHDPLFTGLNHCCPQFDAAFSADLFGLMLQTVGPNAAITAVGVILIRSDVAAGA